MAKKPAFRTGLQEFVKKETGGSLSSLDDIRRSHYMTRFYVERILRYLTPGLVPEDDEDLGECYVDRPGDQQADFIHRADGRVLIVQVKYRSKKKTEDEASFDHFCNILDRLHPESGSEYKKHEQLLESLADIDWKNDTFELHYITLGKGSDDIRAREAKGLISSPVLHDIEDRADVVFSDEHDLNERFREALSAEAGIPMEVEVRFSRKSAGQPWLTYEDIGGRKSFVGSVNAGQLRELYRRYRCRLFALNIRNYVGETTTNRGIIATAMNSPEEFFFYNNGISAVATKIVPVEETCTLCCERFSVINGAQTVRALSKAHVRDAKSVGAAEVLIRVTHVSLRKKGREQEFLENVTRFNNTQNSIKISDFRSNDPIQIELGKRFEKISRGGKKYWYKNKRTKEKKPNRTAIGLEEFAKTIFAFRFGPSDSHGGTRFLFDPGKDGGYVRIFGDGEVSWEALSEEDFRLLAGTWFLCHAIRQCWKSEKEEQQLKEEQLLKSKGIADTPAIAKSALERRWMVLFAAGEAMRARYQDQDLLDDHIRGLSRPRWLDQVDGARAAASAYTQYACETLVKLYRADAKNPSFAHRNWFRSKKTLENIILEINTSQSLLASLSKLTSDLE